MPAQSLRAKLVERRTYLRPTNDAGDAFETKSQAVDRQISHQRMLWTNAKKEQFKHLLMEANELRFAGKLTESIDKRSEYVRASALSLVEEKELEELRALIVSRKASLSGRVKWMAGTDVIRDRPSAAFNCFEQSTSFITDRGVRTFADFRDGDVINVWTHKGRWREAVVRSYGRQMLNAITFGRSKANVELRATGNHRWLLSDGSETTALRERERLIAPVSTFDDFTFDTAEPDEKSWWCYGFVFGGGTRTTKAGKVTGSMVRLCGAKSEYLSRFSEVGFGHSFPPSCNGDPMVYTGVYAKTLPEDGVDPRMLRAFVRGYLDADGSRPSYASPNTFCSIQATGRDTQDFIRRMFPVAGVFISAERVVDNITNFGARTDETVAFSLFTQAGASTNGSNYVVRSIRETYEEIVWCLEVDEDHSFTMPSGIVTGNCSFTEVQIPADFVDAFWLLLQGCGVGFRPVPGMLKGFAEPMSVHTVPSNRTERGGAEDTVETFDGVTWTIKFGDSAKAWAKGVGKLMAHRYRAERLVLDYSELRPAGQRLRGYGWISSGWKPFAEGMTIIANVMNARAGLVDEYLDALDIGDIMNALGTVLSSRRSAQIWLHNYESPDLDTFIHAKDGIYGPKGKFWREQSNNSISFKERPAKGLLKGLLENVLMGGEPGLYNMGAALKKAPWAKGTNPCGEIILPSKGFCVDAKTPLITRQGLFPIKDLVGREVDVWNGKKWSTVKPYHTGDGVTMFRVTANDGSTLDVTANHRFQVWTKHKSAAWADGVEHNLTAEDLWFLSGDENCVMRLPDFTMDGDYGSLFEGDPYTAGVFFADGCNSTASTPSVDLYGVKMTLPVVGRPEQKARCNGNGTEYLRVSGLNIPADLVASIKSDLSPVFGWCKADRLAFLAGALDGDGSETGTGGVRLYVGSQALAEQVQLLLRTVGLKGSVNLMAKAGEVTNLCERKSDVWYVQITDARTIPTHRLDVSGGHECTGKGRFQLIKSVERLPELGDSYCFTESERGMGVFGNMLTYQCNLVQVVWSRFNGDFAGLRRATWVMARANYRQTLVDMRDGVLQLPWHDNNKLLRLCGVSPTGVVGSDLADDVGKVATLRADAVFAANAMADEVAQNRPALVTQVQPAGTSSKVLGEEGDEVQEGAHISPSRFLFNHVMFSEHDPLVEKARDAGYTVQRHPTQNTAVLIALPVAFPASPIYKKVTISTGETIEVSSETAIDQLERYLMLMTHWVDHNCSITISFDASEITDIVNWIYEHWDHYVGVSFMARNDPTKTAADLGFAYLPQEAVSEERYRAYVETLKPIDLEDDVTQDAIGDLAACSAGACPIK